MLAVEQMEHESRAMFDGQVHDIDKVANVVEKIKRRLEDSLNIKLTEVCIAAAGRSLKLNLRERKKY